MSSQQQFLSKGMKRLEWFSNIIATNHCQNHNSNLPNSFFYETAHIFIWTTYWLLIYLKVQVLSVASSDLIFLAIWLGHMQSGHFSRITDNEIVLAGLRHMRLQITKSEIWVTTAKAQLGNCGLWFQYVDPSWQILQLRTNLNALD